MAEPISDVSKVSYCVCPHPVFCSAETDRPIPEKSRSGREHPKTDSLIARRGLTIRRCVPPSRDPKFCSVRSMFLSVRTSWNKVPKSSLSRSAMCRRSSNEMLAGRSVVVAVNNIENKFVYYLGRPTPFLPSSNRGYLNSTKEPKKSF